MKNYKLILAIAMMICAITTFSQQTERIYLSGTDAANTVEWDFYCTDGQNSGEWTKIDVPSNWELQGFGVYNYGHDWRNKEMKLGTEHGLYKYEFEVPASWKGKTVNIVFDGSMTDTKVKINGKSAGELHQGGFTRFKYDISKLVKYGRSNILEVDVAKHSANESINRAERQADFWIFGGIYRPVFLEALPKIHMTRTAIDARADGTFNSLICLNSPAKDFQIEVNLFNLSGGKEGETLRFPVEKGTDELQIEGKFKSTNAWNPEWPTLYDMKISLKSGDNVLHEVTERIGFRTVELRKHDGFYVNGEKVIFKGVNRHSFWPETGRCLSEAHHLEDIRLMKDMNMNAVRCSHYVPDKRFLELCDSLGLFVLDEVTGWQDGYDTIVGPRLIKEVVLKDENHPCVVIWDHGNEGGWDFANEKWIHHWDIQKRPVIYPWLLRNGVETHHYPEYNLGIGKNIFGNDPFMATELLHGLYDGGHGAGLEEYWRSYESTPLLAGGFLWVFADEAVLRTDKEGVVFDSDGNHAPDGIVGPHREKEGSYYTVKEIWSPVQIEPLALNRKWDKKLYVSNKYIYTDLIDCSFTWKARKTHLESAAANPEDVVAQGRLGGIRAKPGETRMLEIQFDSEDFLQEADLFEITAIGPQGEHLNTWAWPVVQPEEKAKELLENISNEGTELLVDEESESIRVEANGMEYLFRKSDGVLLSVKSDNQSISLSGGPVPVGVESEINETKWSKNDAGEFVFEVFRRGYPMKSTWTVKKSGLLGLECDPIRRNRSDVDFIGITFNYPEEKCQGITWMGKGPYRVWKNRTKGGNVGVWTKEYNNTITGESFNELIYPEFKGYHGTLYWMTLETSESDFTVISETPNLYFQLFTPGKPQKPTPGTYPVFPDGDLSFLYEIPAIGTKFKTADKLGPQSFKGVYKGHRGDQGYPIKLWFEFRNN